MLEPALLTAAEHLPTQEPVVYSGGMSRKRRKQADDISRSLDPVPIRTASRVIGVASVTDWIKRNSAVSVLVISLLTMSITWFMLLEPQFEGNLLYRLDKHIDQKLDAPLQQISDNSKDISQMKGQLKVLDPLIIERLERRIGSSATLNPKELEAALPDLKAAVIAASRAKVAIDPGIVAKGGQRIIDLAATQPSQASIWEIATDFLNYRSFLNSSATPSTPGPEFIVHPGVTYYGVWSPSGKAPTLIAYGNVPPEQSAVLEHIGSGLNKGNPVHNAFVVVEDGVFAIDGMDMRNIIVRNCTVIYRGGPVHMQNVYFVNCKFDIIRGQNGQELARAVLESPSVGFSAS